MWSPLKHSYRTASANTARKDPPTSGIDKFIKIKTVFIAHKLFYTSYSTVALVKRNKQVSHRCDYGESSPFRQQIAFPIS